MRMAKKLRPPEKPPKLVRRLFDLGKCKREGNPTEGAEKALKDLAQDQDEVTLAVRFLGRLDRLEYLERLEEEPALALLREAARTDLTRPEAIAVLKAFEERDERMEAAAKRRLGPQHGKRVIDVNVRVQNNRAAHGELNRVAWETGRDLIAQCAGSAVGEARDRDCCGYRLTGRERANCSDDA